MQHTLAVVLAGSDARSVALAHALCYLHTQNAVEGREAAEQRHHAFRHAVPAPPVLVPLLLTSTHAHQAAGAAAISATAAPSHAALDIQDAASARTAAIQVASPSSSDHSRQPQSDQPHAPRLPSLTAAQASLLASASAVLLPYSPAHRASFDAIQQLLALMQSHAKARTLCTGGLAKAPLPVQVLSVGIEGERPEVGDAEAAAWVANASRHSDSSATAARGTSGLAVGFTPLVLCAQRWTESVAHEAAMQARRAEAAAAVATAAAAASQGRWWHQLCGSSSSTSTSDGNDSPAAWWTDSPTPEVEEADLQRAIEDPTPDSDVLNCSKRSRSAAVAVAAATADATVDEETLLATAAATSTAISHSHSHQHPLPSPTSSEVESLLAQDARAAREDESSILDESLSLPRPLSASLHADSSALVCLAACKRKCSAASSSSGTSSSASASGAHSRSESCCVAFAAVPALEPKAPMSLWCLAHGAGCAGIRDHACLVQLRSRSPSGPLAPWPAAALDSVPASESSTSPCSSACSGVSSSRESPAALQLLRSRKNSHHKQQQQQSPACAARSLGLQPPKPLVRAWSDGDSEVLAAIMPLNCPDGAATDAAAAAALPAMLFPTMATAPATHTQTVSGAFKHHPTRSPFARYSDSAAASAHTTPVVPTVPAQPLQPWPSAGVAVLPPDPLCAAHDSRSCTCRGAIVWLLDVVLSGLAANGASGGGSGSGAQWHIFSSQSQRWHAPSVSHAGDIDGHGVALSVAHQSAARSKSDLLHARWGSAGWIAATLLLLFCALLYSLVILRPAEPVAIGAGAGTAVDPAHWSVVFGPANLNDVDPLDLEFGARALELGDHPLPLNAMSHF